MKLQSACLETQRILQQQHSCPMLVYLISKANESFPLNVLNYEINLLSYYFLKDFQYVFIVHY